ncbi:MAG: hypothetical protein HFH40_01350 [Lachnospiraceae bacterium]|nr:hypothetical protein [Lachnospiraceae bacterium]
MDAVLGMALLIEPDAASGKASPTQTGQRSRELIAKGGMETIGYWM